MKIRRRFCFGLLGACILGSGPSLYADDSAGQKITIDGDVKDWSSIPPVIKAAKSPDAEQKPEVDVQQLKASSDYKNLYLFVATTMPPLTKVEEDTGGVAKSLFVVYVDTDGDATTGCKDLVLLGSNGRKISGFDLQLVASIGRNAGSLGALRAKDGPFARYNTFASRNGSFSFRDRKRLKEEYSIYRNPLVAHCPKGIELALPLETYEIKSGTKIRLLMHKHGSMKNAVYSECVFEVIDEKRGQ